MDTVHPTSHRVWT